MSLRMILPMLAAASALFLNGCVTGALWQQSAFHVPAPDPQLKLSLSAPTSDILVEYTALNERTDKAQRRAYFLSADEDRIEQRKKPRFVHPRRYPNLEALPIYSVDGVPHSVSPPAIPYATTNHYGFTLHSPGHHSSTHSLPVFFDGVTRTKQVILTPPALLIDASIVGSIIGGIILHGMAQGQTGHTW